MSCKAFFIGPAGDILLESLEDIGISRKGLGWLSDFAGKPDDAPVSISLVAAADECKRAVVLEAFFSQ